MVVDFIYLRRGGEAYEEHFQQTILGFTESKVKGFLLSSAEVGSGITSLQGTPRRMREHQPHLHSTGMSSGVGTRHIYAWFYFVPQPPKHGRVLSTFQGSGEGLVRKVAAVPA